MGDREDADLVPAQRLEQRVGERVQEAPAHTMLERHRSLRKGCDLRERARDLGKEGITEAWALQLVEIDGLVQLALGGDVEAQAGAHPRRAGALASISLARRGPPDGGTQLKRAKPEQP